MPYSQQSLGIKARQIYILQARLCHLSTAVDRHLYFWRAITPHTQPNLCGHAFIAHEYGTGGTFSLAAPEDCEQKKYEARSPLNNSPVPHRVLFQLEVRQGYALPCQVTGIQQIELEVGVMFSFAQPISFTPVYQAAFVINGLSCLLSGQSLAKAISFVSALLPNLR
jgi:hypothetical protein